jgi:hypothetical protein
MKFPKRNNDSQFRKKTIQKTRNQLTIKYLIGGVFFE